MRAASVRLSWIWAGLARYLSGRAHVHGVAPDTPQDLPLRPLHPGDLLPVERDSQVGTLNLARPHAALRAGGDRRRDQPLNVLFLCTHNSARSILAEGLMTRLGAGRWVGHSAGSQPSGRVNPFALEVLHSLGCVTERMHSKHWHAFVGPRAPVMDLIITVCDDAAGETCPVWPGEPFQLHWGFADPSAVGSDDAARRAAFQATARQIAARIGTFIEQDRTPRQDRTVP